MPWLRLIWIIGPAVVAFFVYGWGSQIITNYTEMPKQIQQLKRDKALILSRVGSYQTLLARRDAAIEASQCKVQIQKWIKDPDTIPTPFDPFNQLGRMKLQ